MEGTVRLFNGETWIDAAKGDFLYVPQGGIHAFSNESGAPARMLILFAPGPPREEYFTEASQLPGRHPIRGGGAAHRVAEPQLSLPMAKVRVAVCRPM